MINEIEKPLIGPKPKANKKTAANNVVNLESRIVTFLLNKVLISHCLI